MYSIATVNVRGLRNAKKRKEMFVFFKKSEYDVICIQESHSNDQDEEIWSNEWGNKIIYSHGTTEAKGVAILINPKCKAQITVNKTTSDNDGRLLIVNINIGEKKILVANLYAPNEDNPEFFEKAFSLIAAHDQADQIIVGDFNLVLDPKKDSYNRKGNNNKSCEIIKLYMDQAMVVDVYREFNPETFRFTWTHKNPQHVYARLDLILTNYGLLNNVKKVEISPAYKTDHAPVVILLKDLEEQKRGPGLWKLNNSLLEIHEYVEMMNNNIVEAKKQVADCDDIVQWEYVKEICVKESKR